jgi:hypothetical protein
MESKEELVKAIREWVKIDNEIRILQKEQIQRKKDKKKISVNLMEVMKKNEIDCFDINDGQIVYSKKNVKKPITQKKMTEILSKFFNGDSVKAAEVNNYILENREETVKETILRKINKTDKDEEVESSRLH